MYGFAVEMLSTDAEEHLCMCEYLRVCRNEMKSMSIEEQKIEKNRIDLNEMPILYQNGMKKERIQ